MSSSWHWFITILVLLNIVACVWLIIWSSRQGDASKAESETLDHQWDGDLEERNQPLPRWWLWLFIGTIVWGIGYLVYYPGLGAYAGVGEWSQVSQYEENRARIDALQASQFAALSELSHTELIANADAMQTAGRLFATNCATCHGSDARGATGFPNLRDDAWLYGGDATAITTSIAQGRNGAMPGWAAPLGEAGVTEVVEYVKSLSGMEHDASLAQAGQGRYSMFCIACHGPTGAGMTALGAPDLTDDAWLYGNSDADLRETIAVGRNGQMPAHADLLSEAEIKLLTAYLLSMGESQAAPASNSAQDG